MPYTDQMRSIVSLELGRPLQIDDDDCDVDEPTPVEDECIRQSGIVAPLPGQIASNGLIAVILIARITPQLKRSLRARTIAAVAISTYDEHFKSIMAAYPEPFPIHSQTPLDPRLLTAACALQVLRFHLYRHNLAPGNRASDRVHALERCVSVAKDTAHYIYRSMQPGNAYTPALMASWAARLRTMAPAFFCSHLWRCTLVSILCLEFGVAMSLVQASAAIGDLRVNNISCGRYLTFFLDKLIGRLRMGASKEDLAADEEMLVYASGDMQGISEGSWAWHGSEKGANMDQPTPTGFRANGPVPVSEYTTSGARALTEREMQEWGGWEHIQHTVQQLLHEQQSAQATPGPPPPDFSLVATANHYPPPPPISMPSSSSHSSLTPQANMLPPPSVSPALTPMSNGVTGNGGSSRISIKDIM